MYPAEWIFPHSVDKDTKYQKGELVGVIFIIYVKCMLSIIKPRSDWLQGSSFLLFYIIHGSNSVETLHLVDSYV